MPKKTAPRKSPLHFDRIPVAEVVKKIGPDDIATRRKKDGGDLTAEPGPRPRGRSGHFHGVRFYNDSDALCRIVGGFLGSGLEQGDLALLIATPDHTDRIDACLRAHGIDTDNLKRSGRLVTLDAGEMLQLFMVDGMPNPGTFRRTVGSALTQLGRGREHRTIRAYGEMVDLLWKDGRETAATRLETLWNQLATTHEFNLLCGYSMGNFYKGAAIEEICAQHSHLVAENDDPAVLPYRQVESATAP